MWNPHTLLYDPGFQLSVIATIGLIRFSPPLEKRLTWIPERLGLRSIAAATLGTQIAVLPLLLYMTGTLSLVALPANLAVLPAIPLAMISAAVAGAVGILHGGAGMIVGIPSYILLEYAIAMTGFFASIPFSAVALPVFPGWVVAGAYLALGVTLGYHTRSGREVEDERQIPSPGV